MADDFQTPPAMPEVGFTPIMKAWWEDVLDWLVDHRPVGGLGGPLVDAPGGGKIIPNNLAEIAAAVPVPLQPIVTKSGDDWALFITFGTIGQDIEAATGNSVPTIDGTAISATGAGRPKLTLGGDEACVYAAVTLNDDKQITGIVITSSTDPTPPAATDSTANVLLGSITWGDGDNPAPKVERNLSGSQSCGWCGVLKWALA